jgi:multiple sugar transport system permease protein
MKKIRLNYSTQTFLLSIPGLAGFALFYFLPFLLSLNYAVIDNVFKKNFIGTGNFIKLFNNEVYLLALTNTLTFITSATIMLVFCSLILSLISIYAGKIYKYCCFTFLMPVFLPTASTAFIWHNLFNAGGKLNVLELNTPTFFERMFSPQILPLYLILLWKFVGLNTVIIAGELNSVKENVYEAAALDGASGFILHRYITLPLIRNTLFFVVVLSIVNAFSIYKEIYFLFTNDYPPDSVYMLQHFMNNNFKKLNYQNLSAGTLVFVAIVLSIVYLLYRSRMKSIEE